MLHLAFTGRALLADEMGLGKTIQAIAACALLHRLGKVRRALVVTPASLKAEWEEQIRRFTTLPLRLVFGPRCDRVRLYAEPGPPFFTIVNYEQVVADSLDLNRHLRPDIVILDEAQRIKNWASKTAQAVKRLDSRHAFVLTGTPLENRIDELRSIVDFLNPEIFGSLFRFNRDFYTFDDKGRPAAYKNLENLRERIRPVLLRRRKADVETELPDRADRNLFVALTPRQRDEYAAPEADAARLAAIASRRALTLKEQERLLRALAQMRMICDTPAILKNNPCDDCPKLDELARILDGVLADPDVKVIIFSEWETMLARVRDWAGAHGVGHAWHTGSVPQQRRRAEIIAFREDPACRLFLSTDSGSTGLNLQNASVVINCDLPWNPARLEQRVARAWRKNQLRPVTVINLVAEDTIEHAMLGTLANKQNLADGVLDGAGDLSMVSLKGGGQSFLKRLEQVLAAAPANGAASKNKPRAPSLPPQPAADPASAFAAALRERLGPRLLRCDETWLHADNPASALASATLAAPPDAGAPVLLAIVAGNAAEQKPQLETLLAGTPWRGPRPALHVLDAAAWGAIEALRAAGLLTLHARATRPLVAPFDDAGAPESPPSPPPLTPGQQARLDAARALAQRKARAARALLAEELADEALPSLRIAALARAQAASIERRWPEPATLRDTLRPPLDLLWTGGQRPLVQILADETSAPPAPAAARVFAATLLPPPPEGAPPAGL
ncbi:MAG: DEAD/DEAH box helicase [Opitutaceae bacterium]|nr:DEAD/DEAH box helicase [Opitutaceae bacterium]